MDRTPGRSCLRHRIALAGGTIDRRHVPGCRRDPAAWEVRLLFVTLARFERALARVPRR